MEKVKPNELRTGNLVEFSGKTYQVIAISRDILKIQDAEGNILETSIEFVKGIPVTHDLLVDKCGFKCGDKDDFADLWFKYQIGDFVINNNHGKRFELDSDPYTEIKYLHHLQNLVLDLTNTELEIKQPIIP